MPLPDNMAESIGGTLLDVLNTVGVPKEMVMDLASEMVGRHPKFRKELVKCGVKITNAEKGCHGQNAIAELEISQVKRRWNNLMTLSLVWILEIVSRLARDGKDGLPEWNRSLVRPVTYLNGLTSTFMISYSGLRLRRLTQQLMVYTFAVGLEYHTMSVQTCATGFL
jgi:hypothetical protein